MFETFELRQYTLGGYRDHEGKKHSAMPLDSPIPYTPKPRREYKYITNTIDIPQLLLGLLLATSITPDTIKDLSTVVDFPTVRQGDHSIKAVEDSLLALHRLIVINDELSICKIDFDHNEIVISFDYPNESYSKNFSDIRLLLLKTLPTRHSYAYHKIDKELLLKLIEEEFARMSDKVVVDKFYTKLQGSTLYTQHRGFLNETYRIGECKDFGKLLTLFSVKNAKTATAKKIDLMYQIAIERLTVDDKKLPVAVAKLAPVPVAVAVAKLVGGAVPVVLNEGKAQKLYEKNVVPLPPNGGM